MNFDLSEEQRLLKQSVERLLADRYGFEARRAYRKSEQGYSKDMWSLYAELGLLWHCPSTKSMAGSASLLKRQSSWKPSARL